jgi:hypothetical protein
MSRYIVKLMDLKKSKRLIIRMEGVYGIPYPQYHILISKVDISHGGY